MSGARVGASPFREFNANRRRGAAMFSRRVAAGAPVSASLLGQIRDALGTQGSVRWSRIVACTAPGALRVQCRSSWHPSKEAYRLGTHRQGCATYTDPSTRSSIVLMVS